MLVDAIAAASATPPDAASLAGIASLGAPPLGFTATLLSARIGLMSLLDGIGFEEGSNANPGHFVIERAFVD